MTDNLVLAALRRSGADSISSRLRPIGFRHGDLIAETATPIDLVVFPQTGVISLVVPLRPSENIEAAMIGYAGIIGGASLFGAKVHVNTAVAQLPGQGWTMRATDFIELARGHPSFNEFMIAHEQYILAQAEQTAACNARHHIPQRLASWLLRASDAGGSNEMQVTQEFLARTLGVQRASVSVFAGQLQAEGLVQYRRGRVAILDRPALMRRSCECYPALSALYMRLLPEVVAAQMSEAELPELGGQWGAGSPEPSSA